MEGNKNFSLTYNIHWKEDILFRHLFSSIYEALEQNSHWPIMPQKARETDATLIWKNKQILIGDSPSMAHLKKVMGLHLKPM